MPTAEEVARGLSKSSNGRGGKRGSVDNSRRLEAFAGRKGKGEADWGGCDSANMLQVVIGITALGGAVTFALSRDQGAYSVTLLLDGEKQSLWFNGDADLDAELEEVSAVLDSM
jgi:hypothetical protein